MKKLLAVLFLLIFTLICYNFRFQIIYNISTTFGYNEYKANKYLFMFSNKPFQISSVILKRFLDPQWKVKKEFNIALDVKKNFINHNSSQLDFKDGNYYLNIFKLAEKKNFYQKLEYTDTWKNRTPSKIWSINTSGKTVSSESSTRKTMSLIQASPKICGNKLIYARPDGIIGAVDYKTGKKFWHKKYGNTNAGSIRGFYCEYEKNLDNYLIILPTGSGVYCLNASDGSLITSRCGGGHMGIFESRVSPLFFDNIVYVATYKPSGIEAYDFLTGKLLWRTDFQIGKSFFNVGSNPWSNFTIDYKKKLILVNTGSPATKSKLSISDNYKYSGSLLALDLKKGNILWQFQEHKRDTWNHDFVGEPILSPIKIKDKDVVITFSKSGSIYFLDTNNGLPVFPVKKETIHFGNFKYDYKRSTSPKPLLGSNDYYNYLGKDCNNCYLNTTIFGSLPPILKLRRVYDGYAGGAQWPGGSIDTLNNYLIVASNHNLIAETFSDYIADPRTSLPQNQLVQKCTSCHNSEGGVNFKDRTIIPSLFLTTKIHDFSSLNSYLKNNSFHKSLNFNDQELLNAYKALNEYDTRLTDKNQYVHYFMKNQIGVDVDKGVMKRNLKDIPSNKLSMGKITAILLNTGEIAWQIPAGTFKLNNSDIIIGSRSAGGVTNGGNNEGISFFTGSLDKKIYAFRNKDGKYLWSGELPASGSAPPLVHNTSSERWIFVVTAPRGSVASVSSQDIVAFKQKLN